MTTVNGNDKRKRISPEKFEARKLADSLIRDWTEIANEAEKTFDKNEGFGYVVTDREKRFGYVVIDREKTRREIFNKLSSRDEVTNFMKSSALPGEPNEAERRRRYTNIILDPKKPGQIMYVDEARALVKEDMGRSAAMIDIPGVFPLFQLLTKMDKQNGIAGDGRAEALLRDLQVDAGEAEKETIRLAFSKEEIMQMRAVIANSKNTRVQE